MASFGSESKYRHSIGKRTPREQWYENLSISSRSIDTSLIDANAHFFAYAHGSGNGNALSVLPLTSTGKNHIPVSAAAYQLPLVRCGGGQLTAISFDPFVETRVLTGADDGSMKVWEFPDGGMSADITEATTSFSVSGGPLRFVKPHRSAHGLVATAAGQTVQLWSLGAESAFSTLADAHPAEVLSLEWSYGGGSLLTTCKDKMLRVIDPRSGSVSGAVECHGNNRDLKGRWAGAFDNILTFGFSSTRAREIALWDGRNLTTPLHRLRVDTNTGPLFPAFDPDTNLLAVGGRGDVSLRFFEVSSSAVAPLCSCATGEHHIHGLSLLPKTCNDLMANEVLRVLKLSDVDVEPVSLTVPRKHRGTFQSDLFPDTFAHLPSLTADEWIAGEDRDPMLMAIEDPGASRAAPAAARDEDAPAARPRASTASSRWSSALANKFKHIRGAEVDLHRTWFNLPISASAPDGDLLACSPAYFACPSTGGGGSSVVVKSLSAPSKGTPSDPVIVAHRSAVVSLSFSPFDPSVLAVGSDDCDVSVWRVPDGGLSESLGAEDALCYLRGHTNGVRTLDFHPVASSLLLSTSLDNTMRLWDVDAAAEARCFAFEAESGGTFNVSFDYTGDHVAAFHRDRKLRIYDLRCADGSGCTATVQPHAGAKGGRVAWCARDSSNGVVITTGWNRQSIRELKAWDWRNLSEPLKTTTLDQGSGALQPLWDEGAGVLYLCGRGDVSMQSFEVTSADGALAIYKGASFMSRSDPQVCCALLPKTTCDVRSLEITRMLRMTTSAVQPVSFTLPRAQDLKAYFNDDIYPDCRDFSAAPLNAADWIGGAAAEVPLVSLRPAGMELLSEKPVEERTSNSAILMAKVQEERRLERQTSAEFNRMSQLALQYAKYNENLSGGRHGNVDQKNECDDEVSDSEWD